MDFPSSIEYVSRKVDRRVLVQMSSESVLRLINDRSDEKEQNLNRTNET